MEPETEAPYVVSRVVQILHVPECPGAEILTGRLAPLLVGRLDIQLTGQVVATEDVARELGMTGSPTILVDGSDPFAGPGLAPSLSCRLYPDEDGRLGPAPTIEQLRRALRLTCEQALRIRKYAGRLRTAAGNFYRGVVLPREARCRRTVPA